MQNNTGELMKKEVVIIGGGTCALMLACELDPRKYNVGIYEKNAAPGRKFLVAGDGGLNLTHSEEPTNFITRYTPSLFLENAFSAFNNSDLIMWLNHLGIETFTGSSGRVFPKKGTKTISVLKILLDRIRENGFTIYPRCEWKGFDADTNLKVDVRQQEQSLKSDIVIFCIGGASWPVTGSSGDWLGYFRQNGITVHPFEASNCSIVIRWPGAIVSRAAGSALKNCAITCGSVTKYGEVIITSDGMEGSGIYPLSTEIRKQLKEKNHAEIGIDLKPGLSEEQLLKKLKAPGLRGSYTERLSKQLNLSSLQMLLLKNLVPKEDFLNPRTLTRFIKQLTLQIEGMGPIDDAISTVGGIDLSEINGDFELKKMPGHFAIGEMLDYDAPTGGYLLQSCFTMAKTLADMLNSR